MEEKKIRCPFCREWIIEGAIKCRYCGSMLSDAPPQGGIMGYSLGGNHPSGQYSGSRPSSDSYPSGQQPGSKQGSGPYPHTPFTGIELVRYALGDRYEVIDEIGSGGMATVYKAIQRSLGRTVALKVIHQNLVHDQEFVKRFHREAQISASLQHPNIVTIYDVGEAQGVHYMAMEYLEGSDLRTLISRRGHLSPEETLRYVLPLADALDYAHGENLVHRDVKSANIYITNRGRVVLMDFGIVHAATGTKLTRAGAIIGSPEYMSPEQAEGRAVDYRSDLYSLGVVMYECISGQVPFSADTTASVIYKVVHEQPDLSLFSGMDSGVEQLVGELLEKDPKNRPESAKRLKINIDDILHVKASMLKYPEEPSATGEQQKKARKEVKPGSAAENQQPEAVKTKLIEPQTPTPSTRFKDPFQDQMVYVKGGTFTMGSTSGWLDIFSDEKPAHQVTLSDYYIGKFPVTQNQWRRVMGNNPSYFSDCDDCPVENVSWNDIQEFLRKLNQLIGKHYRLPTEAEWEYAARGGSKSLGYKYSGSNSIKEVAWYDSNSSYKTQPVGRKSANELGIHDMSGNVWEWCQDWYGPYTHGSKTNPQGPSSGTNRVLRGGSWFNVARFCRVSFRFRSTPDYRFIYCGFRLALSP